VKRRDGDRFRRLLGETGSVDRSPFAEDYGDMIRNVHNGECCVRTYGTNSERRLRTLSLMVASGLMPFGFRRQYDWSLMGYPV
jgi:hypothetical protein